MERAQNDAGWSDMEGPFTIQTRRRYRVSVIIIVSIMMLWVCNGPSLAQLGKKRPTQESIAAAKRTAVTPPSPWMVMKKVDDACRLIQQKGEDAFTCLEGKDSPFIFSGTYIWIHTLHDSQMRFHPLNPKLEGKKWLYVRDIKGKLYFAELNEVARQDNGGWVEYYWPRPGETEPGLKVTFVKKCIHQGVDYVVACGIYGISKEELEKRLKQEISSDHP